MLFAEAKPDPADEKTWITLGRETEDLLRKQGFKCIAGVDEAGRGPLAGPVVAAACIIPDDAIVHGVNDSKALTEEQVRMQAVSALMPAFQREALFAKLTSDPRIVWATCILDEK